MRVFRNFMHVSLTDDQKAKVNKSKEEMLERFKKK